MLKNSLPKIALWIAVGFVFTAGAVSLLVLAVVSGSDEGPRSGGPASTSWYTAQPPETTDGGTLLPIPTEDPTGPINATPSPSELPTPGTVVTHTVVAVPPGGGGSDGSGSLIAAFGSLLSGAAAVGTLLHAVHLSRQNRSAAATDDDSTRTPAPNS